VSQSFVVDASVAFAWIHPNQATDATNKLLSEVEEGAVIVVPPLWFSEVANSLLVLQRRKKLTLEERRVALETLLKLTLTVDEEPGKVAFGRTSEIAEQCNLTVYDATYLEVCLRRKLALATRDDGLAVAAKKAGVKLI